MVLVEYKDTPFFKKVCEFYSYKFERHSLFTLTCVCSVEMGDFESAMLNGKRVKRDDFPRESFEDPE